MNVYQTTVDAIVAVVERAYDETGRTFTPNAQIAATQYAGEQADALAKIYHQLRVGGEDPDDLREAIQRYLVKTVLPDALQWARSRVTKYGNHGYTVALDLDNTALNFPGQLVPLTHALKSAGGRIGVLTGNSHPEARSMWDAMGYPEPDFWVTHDHRIEGVDLGEWKAQEAKALGVDLLIDDFKHGEVSESYRANAGNHLGLALLVPDGTPRQIAGVTKGWVQKQQSVSRYVDKYAVPTDLASELLQRMKTLDPDPYDPDFAGQFVVSTYFDTPEYALGQARWDAIDYATVRLRHYPSTDSFFIEGKSPGLKVREPISGTDAAKLAQNLSISWLEGQLPDLAREIRRLTGATDLQPVSTVTYKRFARQTEGTRVTLDYGMTDGTRVYDDFLLEIKREGDGPEPPGFSDLPLIPVGISKYLWSLP